jgi:Mrp family chromosome partitioning ATPase
MSKNFQLLWKAARATELFEPQGSARSAEGAAVASLPELVEERLSPPRRLWGDVLADLLGKSALQNCESLGVCPASTRQGAAFLTAALGEWIIQYADEPVLLVEANLRHPALSASLGVPSGPGLVEALFDGASQEDVIHQTGMPRLSVLPAGRALRDRRHKEEMGQRFRSYYRHLRERFPNMIIDLPAADDSDYLTFPFDVPDAIVLAVEPRVTRVSEIQSAGRRLTASGSNVVAAMLNEQR